MEEALVLRRLHVRLSRNQSQTYISDDCVSILCFESVYSSTSVP